ncbi:MAG: ABC transporter ATP-binding protein [Alphaproteobacteria bacterium]|nr:ABC transporter ATP-binding protein [Alphaproteobacteria bacterium]
MVRAGEPLLSVRDLAVGYGPTEALRGVSLELAAGSVIAVLGANGAGKSTLLRAIAGALRPRAGTIILAGREIQGREPHRIAALGVAHVPEGREPFSDLTVRENLLLGAYLRRGRAAVREDLALVERYFPILAERARLPAGRLSGGEQQMLAIARGLMARPRLLLLDEPSLGLAPRLIDQIYEIIDRIHREQGVGIVVVEQSAARALAIARYGYVLEGGRIARASDAAALRDDPRLAALYFGTMPSPRPLGVGGVVDSRNRETE